MKPPTKAEAMKVKLSFHDWTRNGKSIYDTPEGKCLGMYSFHSGTTFTGTLDLDGEEEEQLRAALASGALPAFLVFEETANG